MPAHRRDAILLLLHAGHSGIAKTYRTATQLYFWPNMKADIEQSVANCSPCQTQRQSNPKPHMDRINQPGEAKQPMLHTACDLFSAVGKQWLALVDRFSGYAWTTALRRLDTKAVILHLENWFNDFGQMADLNFAQNSNSSAQRTASSTSSLLPTTQKATD